LLDINLQPWHLDIKMRTTLVIDDDVLDLARELAESRGGSIGEALSFLARRGAEAGTAFHLENGFPVFEVEPGAATFGPDEVQNALDAEDSDVAQYFAKPKSRSR
jgi:hypothetical protein